MPTNAYQEPSDYDANSPDIEIACCPSEADFIVRSRKNPQSVHTYEQFAARRAAYESARLPGPNRGLQPVHS